MILVYSGAIEEGAHQTNPDISLGGYPSDTQIPNDSLSNVFSAASLLAIQNKRRECKMIILQNTEAQAQDLSFQFAVESDSICKYKVAFVSPTVTASGSCFEKIINGAALPLHATFTPIVNGDVITLSDPLASQAYLGIWLVREFDYTAADLQSKSCADWLTQLENEDVSGPTTPNQQETLAMSITYTDQASV